ncbi:MAG TPA: histidinol-phosphate transaminase [Candidatus Dormibacteraeota bacterium]|nr:histidinol-phosphate transaminase [Candidatus Dormibacteraeota bacterium]
MPKTTPVTFASPTRPAGWTWEATNQEVAARYGLPIEQVVRFDQNTAPAPPGAVRELLIGGEFEVALSEYPPSDYGRLISAAAARYGVAREELLVGAGADEILDLVAKTFIPHDGAAVVPIPTYPMYGILTEQRRARVVRVPRLGLDAGYALDVEAVRAGVRSIDGGANLVWLCNPNNPTGTFEPAGAIEALLAGLLADADADARVAPIVMLDEAYIEFAGDSHHNLRATYPRLIVVRTMSKAYAIAGLRVGFAIATPELIDEISTYRPPGSVSIVSVEVAAALLPDDDLLRSRVADVAAERARFAAGLTDAGWTVQPSATNFLLVSFDSPEIADRLAEALLERGLIPRTFPAGHPLDHCIRLTVRNRAQDDRLIEAAREISATA